jgi:ubiquinone/menaquinone biosynthesis C-methylase UbiE
MSIVNPNRLEVALYVAFARTFGRSEYTRFIDGMGLKGKERVMDFGSGPGVMAGMLAQRLEGSGGTVTCVDISKKWIEVAKRRLSGFRNVEFMLGDIRTMPVPEESFDVISIHYVIHDVDASMRPGVVAALARALKPGGRILVDEPRKTGHSLPQPEVKKLFMEVGMKEVDSKFTRLSYIGKFEKTS